MAFWVWIFSLGDHLQFFRYHRIYDGRPKKWLFHVGIGKICIHLRWYGQSQESCTYLCPIFLPYLMFPPRMCFATKSSREHSRTTLSLSLVRWNIWLLARCLHGTWHSRSRIGARVRGPIWPQLRIFRRAHLRRSLPWLYARSQNGDDAEPEDEVDERTQLMDISNDECKSRYVYCANYLLLHPQNFILADADVVAASCLGLHQFCGNPLVPGHFVGPCSISHSRSFANILSPRVYPADLAPPPLLYPSCPLLLLFWIQYL
jgi:hypothetical protein